LRLTFFRVVAAVITLGNIKFVPDPKDDQKSVISNIPEMRKVADLLKVDATALEKALLNREMTVRNETTVIPLKAQAVRKCFLY
jgi:myosin heavy subunit